MSRPTVRALATTAVATALLALLPTSWAQTLDKVKGSGSIAVAYRESSIPFSYLDDKAQPVGFGWEICQRIVDEVRRVTGRADLKVATSP